MKEDTSEVKVVKNVSISILDAKKLTNLLSFVNEFEGKFNYSIHIDVMDNKFVSNTGVDISEIKIVKKYGFYTDVHLMVERPIEDGYLEKALEYGADSITIHYEIPNFSRVLNYLCEVKKSKNIRIGVSVKPNTSIEKLKEFNEKFDMLLIMSVEPGLGGQSFIENTYEKVECARKMFKDKIIQVDGGVNFKVLSKALEYDINSYVIGSYITKSKDYICTLNSIEILHEILNLPKVKDVKFKDERLHVKNGGYALNDMYIGISNIALREFVYHKYKFISLEVLVPFFNSVYHDLRYFALVCLSYMAKFYNEHENLESLVIFLKLNMQNIDNLEFADIAGESILGEILLKSSNRQDILKKFLDCKAFCIKDTEEYAKNHKDVEINKINEYFDTDRVFERRLGIISLTRLVEEDYDFCILCIKKVMYDKRLIIQKATGIVIEKLYQKNPKDTFKFLLDANNFEQVPSIVMSYAYVNMNDEERKIIRRGEKGNV